MQVRTILDIGCGYGSFGAHLFPKQLLTMCIANYEASGSQVQLTLERGLPAMINSFSSKQLPYPSLSFDMLHCARCGIDWDQKGTSYESVQMSQTELRFVDLEFKMIIWYLVPFINFLK